jgi:hypothetical protein
MLVMTRQQRLRREGGKGRPYDAQGVVELRCATRGFRCKLLLLLLELLDCLVVLCENVEDLT